MEQDAANPNERTETGDGYPYISTWRNVGNMICGIGEAASTHDAESIVRERNETVKTIFRWIHEHRRFRSDGATTPLTQK